MDFDPTHLVVVSALKKCKLWQGSALHQHFLYGGVCYKDVQDKYDKLVRATDRTPAEDEWLAALKKTLDNPLDN